MEHWKKLGFVLEGAFLLIACEKKEVPKVDYASEMRSFVIEISQAAKAVSSEFLIIPQNGSPLATVSTNQDGVVASDYLAAIDGQGQEDLFYGYNRDDKKSIPDFTNSMVYYLGIMEANGVEVLTTDYCSTPEFVTDSYQKNNEKGYISYVATERNLTKIPAYTENPYNENADNITNLSEAKNFLYLINPTEEFADKGTFITSLKETNHDLLIVDLGFNEQQLDAADIASLKVKKNGGSRLVICYMSIGEAEDYRWYWKKEWEKKAESPAWLYEENKRWRGNYKVFYWMEEWKQIIYGTPTSYLTRVMEAGFDGVYLDIIDAYEYYKEL